MSTRVVDQAACRPISAPGTTIMLFWSRMRAPGASRAALAVEQDLGRDADDDRAAQRVLRKGALHLRRGRSDEAGDDRERGGEAKHGVMRRALRKRGDDGGAASAGDGNLVALQGLEPRTCGL